MATLVIKPPVPPDWATNSTYSAGTYSGQSNKSAPPSGNVQEGFNEGYPLPGGWLNYMLNNHGTWIDYLNYTERASKMRGNWVTTTGSTPSISTGDFTGLGTGGAGVAMAVGTASSGYDSPYAHCTVTGTSREVNIQANAGVQFPSFFVGSFEADVHMSATGANNLTITVGLADLLPLATGNAGGPVNCVAFQKKSTDTNWQCVTGDGTTLQTNQTGYVGTAPSSSFDALRIDIYGSATTGGLRALFYINGALVCTNSSHIGTTAIEFPTVDILNTSGGANAVTVDVGNLFFQWSRVA